MSSVTPAGSGPGSATDLLLQLGVTIATPDTLADAAAGLLPEFAQVLTSALRGLNKASEPSDSKDFDKQKATTLEIPATASIPGMVEPVITPAVFPVPGLSDATATPASSEAEAVVTHRIMAAPLQRRAMFAAAPEPATGKMLPVPGAALPPMLTPDARPGSADDAPGGSLLAGVVRQPEPVGLQRRSWFPASGGANESMRGPDATPGNAVAAVSVDPSGETGAPAAVPADTETSELSNAAQSGVSMGTAVVDSHGAVARSGTSPTAVTAAVVIPAVRVSSHYDPVATIVVPGRGGLGIPVADGIRGEQPVVPVPATGTAAQAAAADPASGSVAAPAQSVVVPGSTGNAQQVSADTVARLRDRALADGSWYGAVDAAGSARGAVPRTDGSSTGVTADALPLPAESGDRAPVPDESIRAIQRESLPHASRATTQASALATLAGDTPEAVTVPAVSTHAPQPVGQGTAITGAAAGVREPVLPFAPLALGRDTQWAAELDARVRWFAGRGMDVAQIRLDPPELGPLHVTVHSQREGTSVHFATASVQVRELLEQSLPRLRELLEGGGMNLIDVNVAQQHHGSGGQPQQFAGSRADASAVVRSDAIESPIDRPGSAHSGVIDAYV
ncbi:MAG: flagellar hook-length control protein FliK [Pseudomonadales bacterium]|jgi:flagellar hook-length control protein FliK|nr:flagellar hook-length control protein FliK [Pseudomonadales bacterium]MCP5338044.1 flagellar hook-length control protein FliK [Pseudomonadales bacterium]